MRKLSQAELDQIVSDHGEWLRSEGRKGKRADLSDTDLSGLSLAHSDLTNVIVWDANLSRVDMSGAILTVTSLLAVNLTGANMTGVILCHTYIRGAIMTGVTLPTEETWEDYLKISVPKLLTCTGKTIEQIVKSGCWKCHSWTNCPMAVVFGVASLDAIPAEYKKQARQFVMFFDSDLIPEPTCQ